MCEFSEFSTTTKTLDRLDNFQKKKMTFNDTKFVFTKQVIGLKMIEMILQKPSLLNDGHFLNLMNLMMKEENLTK